MELRLAEHETSSLNRVSYNGAIAKTAKPSARAYAFSLELLPRRTLWKRDDDDDDDDEHYSCVETLVLGGLCHFQSVCNGCNEV